MYLGGGGGGGGGDTGGRGTWRSIGRQKGSRNVLIVTRLLLCWLNKYGSTIVQSIFIGM